MSAVDRRLIDWARPARAFIVVVVCLGLVGCALLVAQSWLLAELIADTVSGVQPLDSLTVPLLVLLLVFVARAVVTWAVEAFAHRSSATVKSQLRRAFLDKVLALGTHLARSAPTSPAGDPGDARPGRARPLLRRVPPTGRSRFGRAGGGHRGHRLAGPRGRGDHAVHAATDTDVHGGRGRRHQGEHGTPPRRHAAPGGTVPRQRRRTGDLQGVRLHLGGAAHPGVQRELPPRDHGDPAQGVPLLARARAHRVALHRCGGGLGGSSAGERHHGPAHRPVRPRAGAGGLPASACVGGAVPLERRRDSCCRAGVRGARRPGRR